MTVKEMFYPSATGNGDIYAKLWMPEEEPRAIVQIAHGMAEHIGRYNEFAACLNQYGVLVAANDHAGHGGSIGERGVRGYFGAQDGWNNVVKDIARLRDELRALYPRTPLILMGHSMGSFLMRSFIARDSAGVAALILSGTAGRDRRLPLAKMVAKREIRKNGAKQESARLHGMSFGAYNKQIGSPRTDFDWLSRDEERVKAYIADPLCGFTFTAEGMLDLFTGLQDIEGTRWASRVPDIPILLLSGDKDPVGGQGKGVRQVEGWLKDTGHTTTLKLYEGGRHEMLNETNRQDVYVDILAFIKSVAAIDAPPVSGGAKA